MTAMNERKKLDIVDTQIHIGPGYIEETLAAMDALGIRSVMVDEYWVQKMNNEPYHQLDNGAIRPVCPTAELAAQMYPERFSWMLRVKRDDPEYASVIRQVKDAPGGKAIRLDAGMNPLDIKAFGDGGYDEVLKTIDENNLPVFIYLPDQPEMIARAAERFTNLRMIVDHCGLYNNPMRAALSGTPPLSKEEQMALYDRVLRLSDYPNVALKWAHTSEMFEAPVYPGTELMPVLRKTIQAFGADRIMWASDFSVNQMGETWAEILFGMRNQAELTEEEVTAIMGQTARTWLNWANRM